MLKSGLYLFFLLVFSGSTCSAQSEKSITIYGFSPAYVGKTVEILKVEDYFSYKEALVSSTVVGKDSTFTLELKENTTQKLIVRCNKNSAFLYVQPQGLYEVYLPERDQYDAYRPGGNTVELSFYNLDSTDINYKILAFQRWEDQFLGTYFYTKKVNGVEFSMQLDKFKANVEKAYTGDTNSFFKTFVKFSLASLDDIQQAGARNRYEKHDFYLKFSPVSYENDIYMEYVSKFYKNLVSRLSFETNNRVYLGVLKSSPTRVMTALGGEYSLVNLRIREMVMVKMLSEVYFNGDFPQSNILTIMDSVANYAMFEGTKVIAKNLKNRLLELVPGGKAPDFVLTSPDESKQTLASYAKKYIYFHFYDPSLLENRIEMALLAAMHVKYGKEIQFITIYKNKPHFSEEERKSMEWIHWDAFALEEDNPIFQDYQIYSYSSYALIDGYGYVVASPALGPRPNGEGVTIERTFSAIQKMKASENKK
jgi:hypothetical protein